MFSNSSNFEFLKLYIKLILQKNCLIMKIDKKEAGKNIRKSKTVVSLPTCACSKALTAVRQAVTVLTVLSDW